MKNNPSKTYLLQPKKSLGQNFLRDENIAKKIIAALDIHPDNAIMEIGPGTGMLTKYLLKECQHVVAVEIDRELFRKLTDEFGGSENFVLINQDILSCNWKELTEGWSVWKLVGNLPYHITSPVLFKLFENYRIFETAVFMVQKEVALRITAKPHSKDYGILSVFSQFYADVERLFDVSRNVFVPKPDVTSSVVRFNLRKTLQLERNELETFHQVVRLSFSKRRKMLRNSLRELLQQSSNQASSFDFERRPEQLSVDEFVYLAKQFAGEQFSQ